MKCPNCGLPLEQKARFCGHCGTAVAGGSAGLSVILHDVVGSQIAIGDGNVQIQLSVDGSAQFEPVAGGITLAVREIPVLAPVARPGLVGRDALIEQASQDLRQHRNVQLFGLPGVGRTAVAEAVLQRLAPAGVRAVELRCENRPNTLDSLYQQLVRVFFGKIWFQPEEAVLRVEVATADLSVLIVIMDCDLAPGDLSRLLGTFPGCRFLLTSRLQTLSADAGTAYEVDPLTPGQARELLTRTLGGDLAGLQNVQWEEACRLAGGNVQRLMEHAAFLKRTATRPGPASTQPVPLAEQIAVLVAGLSEPARRVLIALFTFGVPLAPELFGAVTGLPSASGAAGELVAAGLVAEKGGAFVIAPDAGEAVARGTERTDARTAADGLMPLLQAPDPPDPLLLLAVATALHEAGQDAATARLARAAAPLTLAAGEVEAWIKLVALGARASASSRGEPDIEFFLREQRASTLLQGDKIAIMAALAAAGIGLGGQSAPAARAAKPARAANQPGGQAAALSPPDPAQKTAPSAGKKKHTTAGAGAGTGLIAFVFLLRVLVPHLHPHASGPGQAPLPATVNVWMADDSLSVYSSPAGLACSSSTCLGQFTFGTQVTLTSTYQGDGPPLNWVGCDNPTTSAQQPCTVTVRYRTAVCIAPYDASQPSLFTAADCAARVP
jgi:hypothetical protein